MAQRSANNPVAPYSEGLKTNPASADVVADTGALPAGIYEVIGIFGQSAAAVYTVQRRNAANGANVGDTVDVHGPAAATAVVPLRYEILTGERIRVVMQASLTGTSSVALIPQRVA